tara:strand:- start:33 stop:1412 length:1380 start_codon:yes stop_codon:yes gene_type:complete
MARYPTNNRFNAIFHLGHVDRVYPSVSDSVEATYGSTKHEPQKIRFVDVIATKSNQDYKFAIPLLRGVSDSITRGDLILYTILGDKTFYLGPINTKNIPSNSSDHTYSTSKGYIRRKTTDGDDGYNIDIPKKSVEKMAKSTNLKMDFVGELDENNNPLSKSDIQLQDTIFTDLMLEGRYGNSIRIGARDKFPNIIISNNNAGDVESLEIGTSTIGMTSIGAITDNFLNDDYTLSCDVEQKIINIGNDVVNESIPENIFNYGYGEKGLVLDEIPKSQIIISSDRIIFDSMHEDITISSNRNINFGANKNFTITNKGFSVFETKNIYIGRQAKNRTQPMVLGEELRNLLIRILRVLADAQALGDMNVPQPLTLFPSIHKAGTLRDEIQNIMTDFRLGELIPGENPPSPNPSTLLNVEQDDKGNPVPVGDRITAQASFLSQYHFIEENKRPDPNEPQAETQE